MIGFVFFFVFFGFSIELLFSNIWIKICFVSDKNSYVSSILILMRFISQVKMFVRDSKSELLRRANIFVIIVQSELNCCLSIFLSRSQFMQWFVYHKPTYIGCTHQTEKSDQFQIYPANHFYCTRDVELMLLRITAVVLSIFLLYL